MRAGIGERFDRPRMQKAPPTGGAFRDKRDGLAVLLTGLVLLAGLLLPALLLLTTLLLAALLLTTLLAGLVTLLLLAGLILILVILSHGSSFLKIRTEDATRTPRPDDESTRQRSLRSARVMNWNLVP
jgi:hypothetical protein